MVFYIESTAVNPSAFLYMGRDKFENEELLRWGWPEDIWFHVDDLSSAHVYLRLNEKIPTINDIPEKLLQDCCQLVKANSIKGNKLNDVDIIYTPWPNLHKTGDMVVGQIGFHDKSKVKNYTVSRRDNAVVNRLTKTQKEVTMVDFRAQREDRDREEREKMRHVEKVRREAEKSEKAERLKLAQQQSYDSLMDPTKMISNLSKNQNLEDDFM